MIYTAALVSAHPSAILELLAYNLTIIKASQQYDGLLWRSYDVYYRVSAAAASGNQKWSRLDTDLFTQFFTGRARLCAMCDSVSHGSADCPSAPSSASSPELAVQLLCPSRSGGRCGLRTYVQTSMLRGPACSARGASSGTCAPSVGVGWPLCEIVVVEAAPSRTLTL